MPATALAIALGIAVLAPRRAHAQAPVADAAPDDQSTPAPALARHDVETDGGDDVLTPPARHRTRRAPSFDGTPWALLGSGAAIAVLGAILLGVGYADLATASRANVSYASVADAALRVPIETAAGWVALPVGLALAGVGLALVLTQGDGHPSATMRLTPTGVAIGGDF